MSLSASSANIRHRLQRLVRFGLGGVFVAMVGLAGCTNQPVFQNAAVAAAPHAPQSTPAQQTSAASAALTQHFARLQRHLLAQGLLRQDGGGIDTPFSDTDLARNFVRIALFDEYRDDADLRSPHATDSRLRRWDQPLRMHVIFDDSLSVEDQERDRAEVAAYVRRLSALTRTPITLTDRNPNFHLLFLSEDNRLAYGPRIRQMIPSLPDSTVNALVSLPKDQLCVVVGTFDPVRSTYAQALAIIRTEHPPLMRRACIHEELAQGMGLANDSPQARPSIFNDDEEFALLTTHDMLLLQILYDPRLRPGMQAAEAAPIAAEIAQQMLSAGSS